MNTDELLQLPRIGKISWEDEFRFPEENENMYVKTSRADHWDRIFIEDQKPVKRWFDVNGETHYKPLFNFGIEKGDYKYAFFIEDKASKDALRKFNDEKWAKMFPWLK